MKPEFFTHTQLFDLEQKTRMPIRIAFSGLWTVCDRDGRFRWNPRELKVHILPYDDLDFAKVLDALEAHGFIARYEIDGSSYGYIPSWKKHQLINNREKGSKIPAPDATNADKNSTPNLFNDLTRESRVVEVPLQRTSGTGRGTGTGTGTGTEGGSVKNSTAENPQPQKTPPPHQVAVYHDDNVKPIASKQRYTQADFDERDLRKLNEAYNKFEQMTQASVGGGGQKLSEKEVFEWVCLRAGITVARGLELEKLQKQWPEGARVGS